MKKTILVATLATLVVSSFSLPLASATDVQTGQAAFICPGATACASNNLLSISTPHVIPSNNFLGGGLCTIFLTAPAGASSNSECVAVFTAFSSTGALSQKNVLVTLKISTPFTDAPVAHFFVGAAFGSDTIREAGRVITNSIVPYEKTFSLLGVRHVVVQLDCMFPTSGGEATGPCTPNLQLLPAHEFYTIEWQIEDPPGTNTNVFPSMDILAVVAVTGVLFGVAVYITKYRRTPSAKPLEPGAH